MDRAMRASIGLVVPAFDRGGLEQVVFNLYRCYRAAGHRCTILVENNQAGYFSSQMAEKGDLYIFNRDEHLFLSQCIKREINVLHYHYSTFGLYGAKALGILTLYTIHNVYTWLDQGAFEKRSREVLSADHVVAVSTAVRNYFCRRAGADIFMVDVIPNGIDLEALNEGTERCRRAEFGLPEGPIIVANVASFHRNKHQALSVAALERLAERGRNVLLVLAGNVGDRGYHEEIQDLVGSSPARDQIRFVGYVGREKIASFYRDVVDILLLPSLQEGASNVVLEALAFAKPMVLTDTGTAREAADLSDQVRVVPAAYTDILSLTAEDVDRLSRTGETSNLKALVEALDDMVGLVRAGSVERTGTSRDKISAERMASYYLDLVAGSVDALLFRE